jgi:hypothetical protein
LAAESLTPVLLFDGHYFVYIMKKVKKKIDLKKFLISKLTLMSIKTKKQSRQFVGK